MSARLRENCIVNHATNLTMTTIAQRIFKLRKPALILFLVWTLAGLSFGGIFALIGNVRNEPFLTVLISNMSRYYAWGAISPLFYLFAKRFEVLGSERRFVNVVLNLAFGIALSIVFALAFVLFFDSGGPIVSRSDAIRQLLPVSTFYTLISFYLPTILTVHAILFFRNYTSEESKNAELKAQLSSAELAALKMQLHPHFLFNSLHAVSSLIMVDPLRANRIVALLGDFLRLTLDHSGEQLVTLEEELKFLRCYLEIEETRFEDRLSVNFDIDDDVLGVAVPHLILQPLAENAVKHGIAPYSSPGTIDISAKRSGSDVYVRITDSGSGSLKESAEGAAGNGVGIANVRARLERIYGADAKLTIKEESPRGFRAELTLPIFAPADKQS